MSLINYISEQVRIRRCGKSLGGRIAETALYVAGVIFSVAGCVDENGPAPEPLVASITATPNKGGKPLDEILEASGSTSGVPIDYYGFDFDDDGMVDYEETPDNAADGAFDGKTTANYPNAGDFTPGVTVGDEWGRTASAQTTIEVGYGDDIVGAGDSIETILGSSYSFTRNQVVQIPDVREPFLPMYSYTAEIQADGLGEIIYMIYNWDNASQTTVLTNDDREIIDFYNSEIGAPKIIVIEKEDSPLTIESKLLDPLPELTIKNPLMHEGVNITSWWYSDYLTPQLEQTLSKLFDLGVESASFLTTYYQDTTGSTTISPLALKTPMDEGLEYAIEKAKSLGMRTVLKPHVDVRDGSWRGYITFSDEADWASWFASYNDFIMHYAQLAADNDVDMLVIGTELAGTTNRTEWTNQIIPNIRSVYSGKIVYAAHQDNYQNITWWDQLDYIGVNAYFPLTGSFDPTPAELDTAWGTITNQLEVHSQLYNKRIMITEIGYQSFDGANMSPWWAPTTNVDEQEQAQCYEAFLKVLFNKPWVAGIYPWMSYHDPAQNVDGFDFIGKQAEGIVNFWYHMED